MAFTHKKSVVRTKVIWIGPVEDYTEFTNRQLAVESCSSSAAADHLPFGTAIVFNVVEANQGELAADLRSLAGPALDHGLTVHVLADSDATQLHVAHVIKTLSLTGHVNPSTKPSLYIIAENIARHEPGPPPNDALEFRGEALRANAELLLRRAFCDCKHITVTRLAGGMTSDVLSVHAVFRDSLSGPRPLPFFAKIGERSSIEHEHEIYRQYVEHFVPFYLRPSLDYHRCVFGFEYAVLVGNFVEYSESLSNVARRKHRSRCDSFPF